MSHNAADEAKMGTLHSVVADRLIEQLQGKPIYNDDGKQIGTEISDRAISNAITFLNNNKIVMNPFLTDKISEIQSKLQDRTKRFAVVKNDAIEAAKRAANDN